MHEAHDYRSRAESYAQLALTAKSSQDRDRLLRMKRSYDLLARSAEFGSALDRHIQSLRA